MSDVRDKPRLAPPSEGVLGSLARLLDALESAAPQDTAFGLRSIDDTRALLTRLRALRTGPMPRIVLICGASGTGKSTLFNAVVGAGLSETSSVRRPTTVGALAAATPAVFDRLAQVGVFSGIDTTTSTTNGVESGRSGALLLKTDAACREGDPVLVDTPDFDTDVTANKTLIDRLLSWADAVVFVTSRERYADRSQIPYMERIAAAGVPVLFVKNRVPPLELDLAKTDFISHLGRYPGHEAPTVLTIPFSDRDAIARDPRIHELREFMRHVDEREIWPRAVDRQVRATREWLDSLKPIETARRRVHDRLTTSGQGAGAFRPTPHLRALAEFEERNKFWLKYSPRGVFGGLRRLVMRPGTIFEKRQTVPPEPGRGHIEAALVNQAREVIDDFLTGAREALKSDEFGRRALEHAPSTTVASEERDLAADLAPLIDRLSDFASLTLRRFKESQPPGARGVLAEIQFHALDKALRLTVLALSFSVLPPLVFELLRLSGRSAFINEVEREFRDCHTLFDECLAKAKQRRIGDYHAVIDRHPWDAGFVERTRDALRALETAARSPS